MIERINRIRGLGVYADYRPAAGMADFGMKNVIYGWNYSGKTTLSRLFAMLEHRQAPPGLPAFEFEFRCDGGVVNEANYQSNTLNVRVFNADFVAANLNFAGDHFNPIFLLGEESKAAIEKMAQCRRLQSKIAQAAARTEAALEKAARDHGAARTATAATIRETMALNASFRADHLDREVQSVRQNPGAAKLSADDLQANLRLARASDQDRLHPLPSSSLDTKLRQLRSEAEPLLAKVPDLANAIQALAQNADVERWVLQGMPLHQHQDDCLFCASPLSEERLAALRTHFSQDLTTHADAIANLLSKVRTSVLAFAPRAESELYASFREGYRDAAANLKQSVNAYNAEVLALQSALERKVESPRTLIPMPASDGKLWADVAQAVAAINTIVAEHNRVSNNFDQAKAQAITKLKAHYAAEFVVKQQLDRLDSERKAREERRGRFHRWRNGVMAAEARQRAIVHKAQRGRQEINERIHSLLGPSSVNIDVVDVDGQERFRLMRQGGRPATYLSEGEKTAIAFAYFMAKLKEVPNLADAIVCIDDPISSLDSNHVFQVVGVIREAFFHQVQANGNMEWRTRCKQLFLLTHNFNFFSLIRELKPDKKKARYCLVKRATPTTSALVDMPAALLNYSSEYHFLFGVLNRFRQERGAEEMELLLMLPNAMRRFVELYSYGRIPTHHEVTVDTRVEMLFGVAPAKRILKALHYFSHANNIERLAENNDLICDIEAAINEMLMLIETEDPKHWQALMEAHT
jgi:wobble nucleotide-excising tRNase